MVLAKLFVRLAVAFLPLLSRLSVCHDALSRDSGAILAAYRALVILWCHKTQKPANFGSLALRSTQGVQKQSADEFPLGHHVAAFSSGGCSQLVE